MKKALLLSLATFLASATAMAQEVGETMTTTAAAGGSVGDSAFYAMSAAFAIGLAAFGGAYAQGRIGATAMEGIARNPQAQQNMFVSMIIGLVLIESLVIYALIIAFMLVTK